MSDDLADRLKNLGKPSRRLDVELYRKLIGPLTEPFKEYQGTVWTGANSSIIVPRYTESLDDAMKLLKAATPPGVLLWVKLVESGGAHGSGKEFWTAELNAVQPIGNDHDKLKGHRWWGIHAFPATALTIAIVRMCEDPNVNAKASHQKEAAAG